MELRANTKYILISPRKVRQVADLIRGKEVAEALDILRFIPKRASLYIEKTIRSCVANANNIPKKEDKPDVDRLYIKKIYIGEGPRYKRIFYRAYGRASMKLRRMSHIYVVLEELAEGVKVKRTKPLKEVKKVKKKKRWR
ncbi:MAG: 50S ribosomal protein L22 [bacterium]